MASKETMLSSDCSDEVYKIRRSVETQPWRRPLPRFMEVVQKNSITAVDRAHLADFLIMMSWKLHLGKEALYLAISLVDRYLSHDAIIGTYKLEVLGITAMHLAYKYEHKEGSADLGILCYGTHTTVRQVLKMERRVLKTLKYYVGGPTAKSFLGFARETTGDQRLYLLAERLARRCLRDCEFCANFLPSMIAASAMFLARYNMKKPELGHPWSEALESLTGYRALELKDCVYALRRMQTRLKDCALEALFSPN